jgi:hypothetical protein
MGISASVAAGNVAKSVVDQEREARRARRQAEADAAKQRALLQAEIDKPPPRLPTDDDRRQAGRRSLRELARRRGRASTILTNQDALGA